MSGESKWEAYVRCRGLEADSPDYKAAETGVPVLLRIWAGEKAVNLILGLAREKKEEESREALPQAC